MKTTVDRNEEASATDGTKSIQMSNPRKRRKHRPKDYPKRPLSAYNIFFKETRETMLAQKEKEVGRDKVDFQALVKDIGEKWKAIPAEERGRVEAMAKVDLQRYKDEVETYQETQAKKARQEKQNQANKESKEAERQSDTASTMELSLIGGQPQAMSATMNELLKSRVLAAGGVSSNGFSLQSVEEKRRVLEEELRALERAREIKLRQLAELQQVTLPGSAVLRGLPQQRPMSTEPRTSTSSELEILRSRSTVPAGLGGLLGSQLQGHSSGAGDTAVVAAAGRPPSSSSALNHLGAFLEEGALRRSLLQEQQDAFAAQLQYQLQRGSSDEEARLSGLGRLAGLGTLPGPLHATTGGEATVSSPSLISTPGYLTLLHQERDRQLLAAAARPSSNSWPGRQDVGTKEEK